MGRFVRLEIRLVIIGINLWRGGGAKKYAAFSRIFNRFVLPTALSRQPCLIGLQHARKRHAFRSKARLVPVLAFSGMWSASIAIAKRQLKQLRLFSRIGGFFCGRPLFFGWFGQWAGARLSGRVNGKSGWNRPNEATGAKITVARWMCRHAMTGGRGAAAIGCACFGLARSWPVLP